MSTDTSYNGWTNYETWAINLWLDNDSGSQEMMQDMARQYRHSAHAKTELADAIKELVQEEMPDVDGLYSDLLQSAIDSANYYEIAEALLENLEPDDEQDEQDSDTDTDEED